MGFAATKALFSAAHSLGLEWPDLSAGHLYGRINGGRDNGAYLADAIEELTRHGCAPSYLVNDLDWTSSSWPADAAAVAMRYRPIRHIDCPTFEELMTAIQTAKVGAAAIDIGRDFTVDPDGWLHDKSGSAGGHALPILGAAPHPTRKAWGLRVQNSWSRDWGIDGYAYVPESYFTGDWTDGWAIEVTTDPKTS